MTKANLTGTQLQKWIEKAQNGDTEAFGKIYDQYFESVYRFAALRVPEAVAEDLTAEVFVKIWEKLDTYTPQKNVPFGAWLFRIARNAVIDAYRTSKDWDEVSIDLSDPDELNRADSAVRRKYIVQCVRKAVNKLPQRYRDVVSLTYMADVPNDEVAKILKLNAGAVRILKHRALKKLETLLPPNFNENV